MKIIEVDKHISYAHFNLVIHQRPEPLILGYAGWRSHLECDQTKPLPWA